MLVISSQTLDFDVAAGTSSQRTVTLTSVHSDTVAWKVMTNAPKRYRVKPTGGTLAPGHDAQVTLILSPGADAVPVELAEWAKDKFLVKTIPLPPGVTEPAEAWKWLNGGCFHPALILLLYVRTKCMIHNG